MKFAMIVMLSKESCKMLKRRYQNSKQHLRMLNDKLRKIEVSFEKK